MNRTDTAGSAGQARAGTCHNSAFQPALGEPMHRWALPVPVALHLPATDRNRLGIAGPLTISRAWPRDPGHLGVEYVTADGASIAGQWFADSDRLKAVARETADASEAPSAIVRDAEILLQARGADRILTALAPIVAGFGTTLLIHRPERSAIVRRVDSTATQFVKVVRPKLVATYAAAGRAAEELAGGAVTTPRLLEADTGSGVISWSGLDGASLYDLMRGKRFEPTSLFAVGEALRAVHDARPSGDLRSHGAADEILGLEAWLERIRPFLPDLHASVSNAAAAVVGALAGGASPGVPVHGDFSDKQVILAAGGRIGFVDWDALALGEAALDLASMLASVEVRTMQGLLTPAGGDEAMAAFLEGYRPEPHVRSRLRAYLDAARLRHACLNGFRPGWARDLPPRLLVRIGSA
jgi:tRNA A-37 threonylcarbamoyl transferase component Bud32